MRWLKLSLWLAFMAGCSTPVAETPKVPQVRANVAGLMPPLPQASAVRPRQGLTPGAPPTSQIATQHWALAWDWVGDQGPVMFEVWHASSLTNFKWAGGTNVPTGFTHWTNVIDSPVPLTATQASEFFIVRAVNAVGPSDWAR